MCGSALISIESRSLCAPAAFTAAAWRFMAVIGSPWPGGPAGLPWEDGYVESFNGKLRDELLDGEIFDTLLEAKVLVERWRWEYNRFTPHSSLGYRPPAPEAVPGTKRSLLEKAG